MTTDSLRIDLGKSTTLTLVFYEKSNSLSFIISTSDHSNSIPFRFDLDNDYSHVLQLIKFIFLNILIK